MLGNVVIAFRPKDGNSDKFPILKIKTIYVKKNSAIIIPREKRFFPGCDVYDSKLFTLSDNRTQICEFKRLVILNFLELYIYI